MATLCAGEDRLITLHIDVRHRDPGAASAVDFEEIVAISLGPREAVAKKSTDTQGPINWKDSIY